MNAFYGALESTKLSRGLTWRQVAAESGVGEPTLSRIASRQRCPDAASLASLGAWSGLNPADFVPDVAGAVEAEPLAKISVFIYSDPRLSREAAVALDELVKATYVRLVKSNDLMI